MIVHLTTDWEYRFQQHGYTWVKLLHENTGAGICPPRGRAHIQHRQRQRRSSRQGKVPTGSSKYSGQLFGNLGSSFTYLATVARRPNGKRIRPVSGYVRGGACFFRVSGFTCVDKGIPVSRKYRMPRWLAIFLYGRCRNTLRKGVHAGFSERIDMPVQPVRVNGAGHALFVTKRAVCRYASAVSKTRTAWR